jgi:hypothetical protein
LTAFRDVNLTTIVFAIGTDAPDDCGNGGYLKVRREPLGWETLDCGAGRGFAVADHQISHLYIPRAEDIKAIKLLLTTTDGVDLILDRAEPRPFGIDHERLGELVVVSAPLRARRE